ncbi:MAG: hypothetical protein U0414_20365 [Polyangiaceae bacterium]
MMRSLSFTLALAACASQPPAGVAPTAAASGWNDDAPPPSALPSAQSTVLPSVPTPDWNAELAWARATYPDLSDLRSDNDIGALLAWVPPGEETLLYLTAGPYRCAPTVGRRATRDDQLIALQIRSPERVVAGHRVRDFVDGQAGAVLRLGFGGGTEERGADGTWSPSAGWGASDVGNAGTLSGVEGDVAHFEGEAVRVEASCGPIVSTPCAGGGSRACNACSEIHFDFTVLNGLRGFHKRSTLADTCSDPCPIVDNRDLTRVTALFAHEDVLYRPLKEDLPAARLYRTLSSCTRDHTKR